MADTQSLVSDVKLFLERLKKDLPEVFGTSAQTPAKEGTPADAQTPLIGGNQVLFNGGLFPAKIYLTPDQETGVEFDGKVFLIYLQNESENPSALITAWLRTKAGEVLPEKVKSWAEKIGVEYNQIFIKDQQTLWASCSGKKNLNFSYRIIKMPAAVQDYLVVHELCHLVHMNHSPEYWALVAQFCPDYKQHRKWLNTNKDAVFAEVSLSRTAKEEA